MENVPLSMNSVHLSISDFEVRLFLLKNSGVQSDWEVNMWYSKIMSKSNPCARWQHLVVIKISEEPLEDNHGSWLASLKSDHGTSSHTAFDW